MRRPAAAAHAASRHHGRTCGGPCSPATATSRAYIGGQDGTSQCATHTPARSTSGSNAEGSMEEKQPARGWGRRAVAYWRTPGALACRPKPCSAAPPVATPPAAATSRACSATVMGQATRNRTSHPKADASNQRQQCRQRTAEDPPRGPGVQPRAQLTLAGERTLPDGCAEVLVPVDPDASRSRGGCQSTTSGSNAERRQRRVCARMGYATQEGTRHPRRDAGPAAAMPRAAWGICSRCRLGISRRLLAVVAYAPGALTCRPGLCLAAAPTATPHQR